MYMTPLDIEGRLIEIGRKSALIKALLRTEQPT